jgi:hypothetical protein
MTHFVSIENCSSCRIYLNLTSQKLYLCLVKFSAVGSLLSVINFGCHYEKYLRNLTQIFAQDLKGEVLDRQPITNKKCLVLSDSHISAHQSVIKERKGFWHPRDGARMHWFEEYVLIKYAPPLECLNSSQTLRWEKGETVQCKVSRRTVHRTSPLHTWLTAVSTAAL